MSLSQEQSVRSKMQNIRDKLHHVSNHYQSLTCDLCSCSFVACPKPSVGDCFLIEVEANNRQQKGASTDTV